MAVKFKMEIFISAQQIKDKIICKASQQNCAFLRQHVSIPFFLNSKK